MRINFILYSSIIAFLITGCLSDKLTKDGLAFIDVSKNYPEKEIFLTDIADVTYLYLNSDDDDYLYKGRIHSITENTVVVVDNVSSSILFFSKDGTPKSHFNHMGQGPGEYGNRPEVIYDEKADEVFVYGFSSVIHVYSSTGEHKRTIKLPQGIGIQELIFFDDYSLFFYDASIVFKREWALSNGSDWPTEDYVLPFYRISRTDGEVLDYVELPGTHLLLGANYSGRWVNAPHLYSLKCPEGVLLCSAGIDTVFLYSGDKSLTPILYQTPSAASLNPVRFLDICLDRGQYQFIKVITVHDRTIPVREGIVFSDIFPMKYYVRDKKTGEIFSQKFLLPDYKGKEFIIDPFDLYGVNMPFDNEYCIELNLYELKQAYRENRLSGKLKDLVATLNEDEDNNVFILVDFK